MKYIKDLVLLFRTRTKKIFEFGIRRRSTGPHSRGRPDVVAINTRAAYKNMTLKMRVIDDILYIDRWMNTSVRDRCNTNDFIMRIMMGDDTWMIHVCSLCWDKFKLTQWNWEHLKPYLFRVSVFVIYDVQAMNINGTSTNKCSRVEFGRETLGPNRLGPGESGSCYSNVRGSFEVDRGGKGQR